VPGAHRAAAALMEGAKAGELFAKTPEIHKLGILADNDPAARRRAGSICRLGDRQAIECLLWVKSGHPTRSTPCPLYPQKRTSELARITRGEAAPAA
jgi:hypothetical protein